MKTKTEQRNEQINLCFDDYFKSIKYGDENKTQTLRANIFDLAKANYLDQLPSNQTWQDNMNEVMRIYGRDTIDDIKQYCAQKTQRLDIGISNQLRFSNNFLSALVYFGRENGKWINKKDIDTLLHETSGKPLVNKMDLEANHY